MDRFYDNITICMKNFLRDKKTQDCYQSWQSHYPGIKFVIIDDGYGNDSQDGFYGRLRAEGHQVVRTAFDIGLTAGRNIAAGLANTKYLLMIDNDHFATEETRLLKMYRILEENKHLSVVGGKIHEDAPESYPRYDGKLEIETTKGGERILRYIPLDYKNCIWYTTDEAKWTDTDITHNFLLIRKSLVDYVKWDESIKIGADHTDFFLDVKAKSFKVGFVPECIVEHNYLVENPHPEYTGFRDRKWYINIFAKKWGVDMIISFDGKMHVLGNKQP